VLYLQEALIRNLIDWVQTAPNPLQSYAAGLLASAMEIQDLAAIFKDSNATLVIISARTMSYLILNLLCLILQCQQQHLSVFLFLDFWYVYLHV